MGCIIRNKRTPVKYRCSFYKKHLEDILLAWYVVLGNHFSLLNEQVERKKLFALRIAFLKLNDLVLRSSLLIALVAFLRFFFCLSKQTLSISGEGFLQASITVFTS